MAGKRPGTTTTGPVGARPPTPAPGALPPLPPDDEKYSYYHKADGSIGRVDKALQAQVGANSATAYENRDRSGAISDDRLWIDDATEWGQKNEGRIAADILTFGGNEVYRGITGEDIPTSGLTNWARGEALDTAGSGVVGGKDGLAPLPGVGAAGAGLGGGGGLADFLGVSGPKTDHIKSDIAYTRGLRDQFADQMGQGPREVPRVDAATATAGTAGPVERVGAPTIDRVAPVGMPRLGQAVRAGATQIDTTGSAEFRGGQKELIGSYQDALTGRTPSLAALQQQDAFNQAVAGQTSFAAGARGSGVAAARRLAARNIARLQGQAAAQGAQLRAGEIERARAGLGGVLEQGRTGDISLAGQQAGLTQQTELANAGAENQRDVDRARLEVDVGQRNADRSQATNTRESELGVTVAQGNQTAANTAAENQANRDTNVSVGNAQQINQVNTGNAGRELEGRQIDDNRDTGIRRDTLAAANSTTEGEQKLIDTEERAKQRRTDLISNTAKGIAGALGVTSDKRAKKDIDTPSGYDVEAFLSAIHPKSWHYKQPGSAGASPGKHFGAMAQDIDDSAIGASFVTPTPSGLMLDPKNAIGPLLIGLKHVNEKIDAIARGRRHAASSMPRR